MSRQAKGEFDDLDSEWKDGIVAMTSEEIDQRIADTAKAEAENQKAKKEDAHLESCRTAVKVASEGYREHTKMSKLRIRYCMQVLGDRGKV
jgi:ElaB/YqjD/DUF883 family membrane-anchored ribosome-binding protein